MINFFRKIRKRLADDNKPLKYMRYAVGEIVLVVIGILIALQVNSWNESLKEKRLTIEYLKSLKSDLIKNKTSIENRYPSIIEYLDDFRQFKQKTQSQNLTTDSLIQLAQYEFIPKRALPMPYNKNTITTLLSTGHLRLIPKELVDDTLNYYTFMDSSLESRKIAESVYQSALESFTSKYAFESTKKNEDGPLLKELIWKDIDPRDLAPKLSRLIKTRGFVLSYSKIENDSLLYKTTELIKKLDLHLAN